MRVKKLMTLTGVDYIPGAEPPAVAVVEANGVERGVRLDIVDVIPKIGDYVIVHAGFAIRTMPPEEALRDLELIQQALKQSS